MSPSSNPQTKVAEEEHTTSLSRTEHSSRRDQARHEFDGKPSVEKADLQKRFDAQSIELNHLHNELGRIKIFLKKPGADISDSDIADHVAGALEAKEVEIEVLRRDLAAAASRNDFQKSREVLSRLKISALSDELAAKASQYESTIQADRSRATNADQTQQLEIALSRVRELQLEVYITTAQFTKLQDRYAIRSKELVSVSNQLQTVTLSNQKKDKIISSVTAERDRQLSANATKAEQIAELTAVQKDLATARAELEQLKHRFDDLSSQTTKLKQGCQTHSAELRLLQEQFSVMPLDSTVEEWSIAQKKIMAEVKEYTDVIKLTTIVDDWMGADAKRAEVLALELEKRNKENEELRHKLDTLKEIHIRAPELKQIFQSQHNMSASSPQSEELGKTYKKITTEVKDYTAVMRLTSTVDEWMSADAKRAESLALELEKRNKENEELRHKLVTLKEIYIRAPRLKQIFQSETIEIKRRYQEESNALKVALAESQSQLRGVQRVVATADTYTDEMIIAMLKKLNAEVQQNTTYMAEHMAEDFRTTKGTKEQVSATQIVSKSIGKTMADCLASMERDDVWLYLPIAFQAYFSYYLLRIIPSWTIEKGHNDFIDAIYEQLQKAEPQPMSGRWRALTRAYISPTWMSNPSSLTQQIVADLSDVVVAAGCAASATAANSKLSSFRDEVLSVISLAGQFSEMIGKVVSADFAVTAPPPLQVFEETTMEQDVDDYDEDHGKASGTAVGQKVLCSTQLGMTKRMHREPGRETLTVIKAKVVLETFLDG